MDRTSIVRRTSVALVLALTLAAGSAYGQRKARALPKKYTSDESPYAKKARTAECSQFTAIGECPLKGCGGDAAEERLNERKNISAADLSTAAATDFDTLRKRLVPAGYTYGVTPNRHLLADAGEGNVVTTAAWLTDIRTGSQETCNCKLSKAADTDNHMVLISDYVINHYKPKYWEKHSFTVEFAPRVKALGHPNFKVTKIGPLIINDPRGRLRVRITGPLMFDDYHQKHPLTKGRQTNWEIHPVFKFEYCPYGQTCLLESNAGWVNIDG